MVRCALLAFGIISAAVLGAAPASAEVLIGLAAPLSGPNAWLGEPTQRGADMAIADLNDQGGVVGEPVRLVLADDYCAPDQAVAAAHKLVAASVALVIGHPCSGAAIPASKVYTEAGVVFISDGATNPRLTDEGSPNVFRVVGRDDQQGAMVGDYLAAHWPDAKLAIVHDGEAYGEGLATEVKRRLNERGVREVVFGTVTPGQVDYFTLVSDLQAKGIRVLFFGGYAPEAGLIRRQAHDAGYDLQLITGDGIVTEDFPLIAGQASEGTLSTSFAEPIDAPSALDVVARFRAQNYEPVAGTLYTYAALQAWAQAVERARTFESDAVAEALRASEFNTVLGRIGFDAKGDVTSFEPWSWFVWQADGTYVPLEEPKPGE